MRECQLMRQYYRVRHMCGNKTKLGENKFCIIETNNRKRRCWIAVQILQVLVHS